MLDYSSGYTACVTPLLVNCYLLCCYLYTCYAVTLLHCYTVTCILVMLLLCYAVMLLCCYTVTLKLSRGHSSRWTILLLGRNLPRKANLKTDTTTPGKLSRAVGFSTRASREARCRFLDCTITGLFLILPCCFYLSLLHTCQ